MTVTDKGAIVAWDSQNVQNSYSYVSYTNYSYRPAITLKANLALASTSGNGTKTSPYVIK